MVRNSPHDVHGTADVEKFWAVTKEVNPLDKLRLFKALEVRSDVIKFTHEINPNHGPSVECFVEFFPANGAKSGENTQKYTQGFL